MKKRQSTLDNARKLSALSPVSHDIVHTYTPIHSNATQFQMGILCRGCLARDRKVSPLPPVLKQNEHHYIQLVQKKRAKNPIVGNTGTHDQV
jgi:hypothetical protein